MSGQKDELVFAPLGGVGEIGMNLALYGYGPERARRWVIVDMGVAFADESLPGIDLIMPDIRFIEEERDNLLGIVLTHAHEDHFGAVIDLWPRLRAPVFATPFTAALLRAKMIDEKVDFDIPITVVELGGRFSLGPFALEFITVTHSIPEPNGLAITTELGMVYHSGDWKIDLTPQIGEPIDVSRLKALGSGGCLALVCDSTNAVREGVSPSEGDVLASLRGIIASAPNRVAVTAFASNVARLRSVALAAAEADRRVVVAGRAMHRVLAVARECGYLEHVPPFISEEEFGYLPRNRAVALVTGSQGEPRAAMSRIAFDDHPQIALTTGDMVIFSSRTIPGNEKAVGRVQNALVLAGMNIVTDADALVHVSGHPRRGELQEMYKWLQPRIVVPVHGEARHLAAQAQFARENAIPDVIRIMNGDLVRLAPGRAEKADELPSGRLVKDGKLLISSDDEGLRERRKLSHVGVVSVSVVLDGKGEVAGEPQAAIVGLPFEDDDGEELSDIVLDAVEGTLKSIPRPRRRDDEVVGEAVRRAVRAAVAEYWGKRPICEVLVTRVR